MKDFKYHNTDRIMDFQCSRRFEKNPIFYVNTPLKSQLLTELVTKEG